MNQILFDSSTGVLVMAIAKDGKMIDFSIRMGKKDHAKHIVERMDQMLKRKHIDINQIDEIIVGYGPGSYTGLRISVMVGKMLAYTKGITLRSVSSLFFLSSGIEGRVCAMVDARNGNVFGGIFENDQVIVEESLRSYDEMRELAKKHNAKPYLIDDYNYEIDTQKILNLSQVVKDVHGFVPNYLRITEAERNLND
ncbi:tRNA threonylcarbamoyladenosine biosynthesis protein TsaB [Acholeplasma morum]|uniref:tRNA (adenosine(37)-N6)-threonylcarbamoyltransferase complex dimerization subunit type 1 TsaB n=1 Tax=Paracholeplasma morum TaxID=264637 RepID=UPI001959A339|nr:tRNA (adenosine(37)-N6)-threonylcarbamoyltransferase complex dimerization subunit type 1 TsaB [Paracholeplasma morum]MBM7453152.1 tRNA threonylcarbamoyladenosine biosynthesis protein TsaB [Paracholeplasma morum]